MTARRGLGIAVVVVVAAGIVLLLTVGRRQWRIAEIANRNLNKTVCSCVFVGQRSLEACIDDVPPAEKLHIRWVDFDLDRTPGQERLTTTMFRVLTSTAVYEPRTGCTQY